MAIYSTLEGCKPKLIKVQTDVLDELLYADDIGKNSNSEAKCKESWIKSLGHVISAQKDRGCTPASTRKTVQ